jgi:hypothetical protein
MSVGVVEKTMGWALMDVVGSSERETTTVVGEVVCGCVVWFCVFPCLSVSFRVVSCLG